MARAFRSALVIGALGPDRSAPSDVPLTITAAPYDPAEARDALGAAYPFTYEWSCALGIGGEDCFASGSTGASALLQGRAWQRLIAMSFNAF